MENNSIAKNAFFKLLLNLFNVIVPIIIGPYVARKLGSDLLGTINFAQSINGYFYIFASFGIYNYGLREISRKRENEKEVRQTFTSLFIFTIITNTLIGIAYIVEFGKNICIDAGQSSIATKLEMAGKVIIVVLTIPLISSLVNVLTGLV